MGAVRPCSGPCAAPGRPSKRARMSTARAAAGGWRAQGDADGQEMGFCGGRTCSGDGLRGSAMLRGERRWVARASLGHCQGPRSRADRVAECFDSGADWWSLAAQVSRSTSVVTAVAFTALCFACVGRIMANSLAAAQICAHGSLAQKGSSPQKRCMLCLGCALCSGTCSAIGTHHDLRSAAAGFGVRAGW